MTILDRIKELASIKKISLAELERRTGLSSGSITKWDKSSPSIDKLKLVANFFDVSIDYLSGNSLESDILDEEPVSYFRIDTTNLSESEISQLEEEMEEYQEFIKKRLQMKRERRKGLD